MKKEIVVLVFLLLTGMFVKAQDDYTKIHTASAPLYNDPIYDGAADPVMIWNREEKSWWML